jgi:hypothetical protein
MLSRFCSTKEIKETLKGMETGEVDIVIGTHRLLSKDISFKHLGLLIIDEEQRFGVAHKERIKQLKKDVDVLTLTATPIPRTLHMSLLKIRDMARKAGKEFQSGGRTAYNASFGCLYGENERIEFHAPISEPVHELMLNVPEIHDGKCFVRTDINGIPIRMNLEKIEKMGYLD